MLRSQDFIKKVLHQFFLFIDLVEYNTRSLQHPMRCKHVKCGHQHVTACHRRVQGLESSVLGYLVCILLALNVSWPWEGRPMASSDQHFFTPVGSPPFSCSFFLFLVFLFPLPEWLRQFVPTRCTILYPDHHGAFTSLEILDTSNY